jgi:hypothetical protein
MLRRGRFSGKFLVELPTHKTLETHIARWLQHRHVLLEPDLDAPAVVDSMVEANIANAEAVIQAELNLAISAEPCP